MTTLVPGEAVGQFVGGTTTLLAATLGTPWEIETTTGRIVLLEDINEQPYALDRMLAQLLQAGKLKDAAGLPLGHGYHIATIPLGVKAHLNASIGALTFLEPALR